MTDPHAHDLGPNSWAESSAHMVQDTLSYAAAASPSRGPAGVDAEMASSNIAATVMILSPILVLCVTAGECLTLKGSTIAPITSCPRGRCPLFLLLARRQRTRRRIFFRIFKTLVYLHMVLDACNAFPMTVSVLPLARRTIVTPF